MLWRSSTTTYLHVNLTRKASPTQVSQMTPQAPPPHQHPKLPPPRAAYPSSARPLPCVQISTSVPQPSRPWSRRHRYAKRRWIRGSCTTTARSGARSLSRYGRGSRCDARSAASGCCIRGGRKGYVILKHGDAIVQGYNMYSRLGGLILHL
jgi:hypothetical protein